MWSDAHPGWFLLWFFLGFQEMRLFNPASGNSQWKLWGHGDKDARSKVIFLHCCFQIPSTQQLFIFGFTLHWKCEHNTLDYLCVNIYLCCSWIVLIRVCVFLTQFQIQNCLKTLGSVILQNQICHPTRGPFKLLFEEEKKWGKEKKTWKEKAKVQHQGSEEHMK